MNTFLYTPSESRKSASAEEKAPFKVIFNQSVFQGSLSITIFQILNLSRFKKYATGMFFEAHPSKCIVTF